MVNNRKFFAEVMEIDVRNTEKYTLWTYDVNVYYDAQFIKFDKRVRIASFNNPVDMRIGKKYLIRNLGYNDKFKNYLWGEKSSVLEVQNNDLWSYM